MLIKRILILIFALLIAFGPEVINVDAQNRKRAKYSKQIKKKVKKKKRKKAINPIRKSKRGVSKKFYFPF